MIEFSTIIMLVSTYLCLTLSLVAKGRKQHIRSGMKVQKIQTVVLLLRGPLSSSGETYSYNYSLLFSVAPSSSSKSEPSSNESIVERGRGVVVRGGTVVADRHRRCHYRKCEAAADAELSPALLWLGSGPLVLLRSDVAAASDVLLQPYVITSASAPGGDLRTK